ncbi:MAG: FixH family protein [Putridiphycobacter sp.]
MKKFNWGHGITIFIVLFMGLIVFMVYKTFTHNADLVRTDYYEQEVLFDAKKESINNYEKLTDKIEVVQKEEGIEFVFPKTPIFDSGDIQFYRPDDKKLDKSYEVKLDDSLKMVLPYTDFVVGRYEINIAWTDANQKDYLHQSTIDF